ncbi:3'-5' exonuclease [Didymella heteroderae]|uniref:3'-5' exonuclease n=1 Tax=Didymella heteroderae TaxID=1769908 RepID=A0A9P5BVV6_9PLEO|nr:3'-5' exonuclease [Didymella heteroderae]
MASTSDEIARTSSYNRNALTTKVAIDCEMMQANIGQVLGRVSVVNYEGRLIFDTFVCYPEPIRVTNTHREYSGIDWSDIDPQHGAQPFSEVQTQLVELLYDRIVIGHDIEKDIRAISMNLQACISRLRRTLQCAPPIAFQMTVRDTQRYSGYQKYAQRGAHQGPSLKILAQQVLGRSIKQGQVSSVEDALATMEIYRTAEDAIDLEQN